MLFLVSSFVYSGPVCFSLVFFQIDRSNHLKIRTYDIVWHLEWLQLINIPVKFFSSVLFRRGFLSMSIKAGSIARLVCVFSNKRTLSRPEVSVYRCSTESAGSLVIRKSPARQFCFFFPVIKCNWNVVSKVFSVIDLGFLSNTVFVIPVVVDWRENQDENVL